MNNRTPSSIVTNEDCMALMARYPYKHFDLAVVDPPYGIGDLTQSHAHPSPGYFAELIRVSRNQIIWGANYYNCFSKSGGALVWIKTEASGSYATCEIASISFRKKVDYIKIDHQSGFMRGIIDEIPIHNCQKPIKLYDFVLRTYAKPWWKILDTHLGSGSSRIAAFRAGLDFVGCELDKGYFDAEEKLWAEFSKQILMC